MGTKKGTIALMPLAKTDELFALLKVVKIFTALDLGRGYYHIKLDKEVKVFTALDLGSGYYHTKLDEESIPKSVFTTVFCKFEFLRCPFGLSQGQDFFIHLIYNLFGLDKTSTHGQSSGYLAYLDDTWIYRRTEKEHLQMLEKISNVFSRPESQ